MVRNRLDSATTDKNDALPLLVVEEVVEGPAAEGRMGLFQSTIEEEIDKVENAKNHAHAALVTIRI